MIPPLESAFQSAIKICKKDANLYRKIWLSNIAELADFASEGSGELASLFM
jgi:hypothetical protein